MSAVDVLAVLNRAILESAYPEAANEAHDAVAELIATVEFVAGAHEMLPNGHAETAASLRAAIARVRGEA